MVELSPVLVPDWPKLAWVATLQRGVARVVVRHGPMVELRDDWLAEAVWVGDFAAGDFDRTEFVFGTGLRVRGDTVVFVSSGTAMDRLWIAEAGGRTYVSNTLGGLSAVAGLTLREDALYVNDRLSPGRTTWGVPSCVRSFPMVGGDVRFAWFTNLVFEDGHLRERPKPDTSLRFTSFADYKGMLFDIARRLGGNLRDPLRQHDVAPLTSVSSGYDSPAAAVVAIEAGCRRAVTIEQSTSFWRGSDSGEPIARRLDMLCDCYPRVPSHYPYESAFWASSGYSNLLNWVQFDYPGSVCLFFIGCYGDAIWDRRPLTGPLTIDIWDDLGLSEWRLIRGVLQCAVPFWGMRHAAQIRDISFSDEMAPWTLGTSYDRPIPRRLVEEAGIPREAFALRKKNSSYEGAFRWPYSREAQVAFHDYLASRGLKAPARWHLSLLRRAAHAEGLLHGNLMRRLGRRQRLVDWSRVRGAQWLFHWANEELKTMYARGLGASADAAGGSDAAAPTAAQREGNA